MKGLWTIAGVSVAIGLIVAARLWDEQEGTTTVSLPKATSTVSATPAHPQIKITKNDSPPEPAPRSGPSREVLENRNFVGSTRNGEPRAPTVVVTPQPQRDVSSSTTHESATPPSPQPRDSSAELVAKFLSLPPVDPTREPVVAEFHKELELEPVDPEWSGPATGMLTSYLATLETNGGLEFPSVQCRATICEIQAVSVLPGDNVRGGPADWQTFSSRMQNEAWFRERFTDPILMVTAAPDGRIIYINYFQRRTE
jgi:hypothetical protein